MSILEDLKDELLEFITQWRDKGFPVSRMCLVRKICALKPEFREKTVEARKMAISRFLAKNNMTHRVATHKAQRCPGEVREEALDAVLARCARRPLLTSQSRSLARTMDVAIRILS